MNDIMSNIDSSKNNLGFKPEITLEQGIRSYIPEIIRFHSQKS